ncbi:hypothetical protein BU17DRAFT_91273 [Hysterangium stoloniferum]|nr:hypothetical protein BU17DRAFT_91273 [Hysterangium stoloniferum]
MAPHTGIPLLIQLALFLFSAGLVLFTWNNSVAFGTLMLCVTISAIYILGTNFPLLSPTCPFQTTASRFFPIISASPKYDTSTSDYCRSLPPTRTYTFRISEWVECLSRFLAELHGKPPRAELEADVLAWVIANTMSKEAVNEALRAIAGAKQCEQMRTALCQLAVTKKLCNILENCFHLTAGIMIVGDQALAEVSLLAMSRVLSPPTDKAVNKEYLMPFKTLLHVGRLLHRLDNLDRCVKTLGWAVYIGI